jgi:poly(A) polymerase
MTSHEKNRDFAVDVVRRLQQAGYQALWAGGCVRDLLMGRAPQDYDVATSAIPDDVRRVFGSKQTIAVGESFGVMIVRGPRGAGQVEVATFRTEGEYRDGRRPERVEFTTAEADAWRRDFTINGMFYDPLVERVHDFVGGEADLKLGIVRAIGEPHDRMREDKLRMLRAVRFTATLDFELHEATARAVREMAPELSIVSAERIAQELKKMLVNRHRRRAVRLLQQVELLTVVFHELEPLLAPEEPREWSHTLDLLDALAEPDFELAMAALLHNVPNPASEPRHELPISGTVRAVCRRLRLSNQESEQITWLVAHQSALDHAPSLPLCRLKWLLAHPWCGNMIKLVQAGVQAAKSDPAAIQFVEQYRRETPPEVINPPPLITGADLIGLGLTPGPQFQELLEQVRDAQLDGEISTADEAREMVRRLSGLAE